MSKLSCEHCGKRARAVCGNCYLVGYCDRECQKHNLVEHRENCHARIWTKENVHDLCAAFSPVRSVAEPWLNAHHTDPNVELPVELRHEVRNALLVGGLAFRAKMLAKLKFGKAAVEQVMRKVDRGDYSLKELEDIADVLTGRFIRKTPERNLLLRKVEREIGKLESQETSQ